MNLNFTISINGAAAVSLESLALGLQSLELSNMQTDQVTLAWTRDGLDEICPLAELDDVEVYLNGGRIFVGRVRLGAVRRDGCMVYVRGPWSHLDEFIAHEKTSGGVGLLRVGDTVTQSVGDGFAVWNGATWVVVDGDIEWTVGYATVYDPGNPNVGTLNVNRYCTSRFWLFTQETLPHLSLQGQVTKLLLYIDHIADVPMFDVGAIDLGALIGPKARTVQDISVAEAMRQTLAAKPDAAVWWDYGGSGLPEIRMRVASAETPLVLTIGEQVLTDYDLTPVEDLKVAGVVIRVELEASESTGRGRPYSMEAYPAGATASYERRVMVQTITEEGSPGAGLAQALYDSLNVDRVRGSLTILDPDWSLGLRPGMVITLEGDAMLEGYEVWVQSVRWSPETGLASLTVGYPDHLQLQELADLRAFFRRTTYLPGALPRQILQVTGA